MERLLSNGFNLSEEVDEISALSLEMTGVRLTPCASAR
jgi:hypothetical protein